MPRTQIKGIHVRDKSIKTVDLADSAVTTLKIKDKNVTEPKLADKCVIESKLSENISTRLLSSSSPIARALFPNGIIAYDDITLPGGIIYTSMQDFTERLLVFIDGQLMWNTSSLLLDPKEVCDVYPGSDETKIKFAFNLRRGTKLQVVHL